MKLLNVIKLQNNKTGITKDNLKSKNKEIIKSTRVLHVIIKLRITLVFPHNSQCMNKFTL